MGAHRSECAGDCEPADGKPESIRVPALTAGTILVLSGPAGAGKDSVTRELEACTSFHKFPSVTTRPMRPGETPSVPYTFVTDAEFDHLHASGRLWNQVWVGGFRYGIQRDELKRAYDRGDQIVLHLTPQWAHRLRCDFPAAVLVLLKPPSLLEQRRRLLHRGATNEEVQRRLTDADIQSPSSEGFDLVLVNETDRLHETVQRVVDLIDGRSRSRGWDVGGMPAQSLATQ